MSDRMVMERMHPVYHPNNEYLYDHEDNYEPDMDDDYFCNDLIFRDPWYTTSEIMGYEDSGVPNGMWFRLEEIPDSFISSFGAIWSDGLGRFRQRHIFYPGKTRKPYWVIYSKEGMFYLHRLMAKYFIPNPYDYPVVRHLNDDGLDCRLSNLAWGTQKENVQDAIRNGKYKGLSKEARIKGNLVRSRPITATNLETGVTTKYPSTCAAARGCGVSQATVSNCIRGKTKGRFLRTRKFAFAEDDK